MAGSTTNESPMDERFLYAVALSGIAWGFALSNATMDPNLGTIGVALGLGVVFLMFCLWAIPAELGMLNERFCEFVGHQWDLEPPWSGKEFQHNPKCEACGFQAECVVITGNHEGDHRV